MTIMTKQKLSDLVKKKKVDEYGIIREKNYTRMKVGKHYSIGFEFKEPILDMHKVEQCVKGHDEELRKEGFEWGISPDVQGGPFSVWISKREKETEKVFHYTQILKEGKIGLTLDPIGKRIFREIMGSCQKQIKILIVDDEESIASMTGRFLAREGYSTNVFTNSADALKELIAGDYDLVISDHKMPGMDGDELIRKIKETKPKIKAIIMSGGTFTAEDMKKEKNKCIDSFIGKPWSLDELKSTIETVVAADSH